MHFQNSVFSCAFQSKSMAPGPDSPQYTFETRICSRFPMKFDDSRAWPPPTRHLQNSASYTPSNQNPWLQSPTAIHNTPSNHAFLSKSMVLGPGHHPQGTFKALLSIRLPIKIQSSGAWPQPTRPSSLDFLYAVQSKRTCAPTNFAILT